MAKKSKKTSPPDVDITYETIKLTDNSCIRINAFRFADDDDGENIQINVRKFYRTQKDRTWKPARQGMTIPLELAKKFRVKLKNVATTAGEDPTEVPMLDKKGDE